MVKLAVNVKGCAMDNRSMVAVRQKTAEWQELVWEKGTDKVALTIVEWYNS